MARHMSAHVISWHDIVLKYITRHTWHDRYMSRHTSVHGTTWLRSMSCRASTMSWQCQSPPISCHVCPALYVSVFFYSVRCRAMYVLSYINCVLPWGMSCTVSCVDVCRAVSWHDILYLHGTTWGMSCSVSCHVVEFGDVLPATQPPTTYSHS